MSNLIVKEVVLNCSKSIDQDVMTLIKGELHSNRTFESFQNNIDYASGSTRILGGFMGDQLVCINAFMRMKFTLENASVTGYQSGFSATSGDHRGKGLWPKLMKFSEDFLSAQGGSFIFGYPNPISHPLFERKLGYRTMAMRDVLIARTPFWPQKCLKPPHNVPKYAGLLKPDMADNIAWKRREAGDAAIRRIRFRNSMAWGKFRTIKKFGFQIKFFDVGGLELGSLSDLQGLINACFREARVVFCYFSMNQENEYFPLFRMARSKVSPVIVKSLGDFSFDHISPNFFGGMRDTF